MIAEILAFLSIFKIGGFPKIEFLGSSVKLIRLSTTDSWDDQNTKNNIIGLEKRFGEIKANTKVGIIRSIDVCPYSGIKLIIGINKFKL